jgi:hypothetical protein
MLFKLTEHCAESLHLKSPLHVFESALIHAALSCLSCNVNMHHFTYFMHKLCYHMCRMEHVVLLETRSESAVDVEVDNQYNAISA